MFRLWRQHGMSVPDTVRHGASEVVFEDYPVIGFNYRMTDLQAAVGRRQLDRLPEIVERRRALAARYRALIAAVPESSRRASRTGRAPTGRAIAYAYPPASISGKSCRRCWTGASPHAGASCAPTSRAPTRRARFASRCRTQSGRAMTAFYCPSIVN